VARLAAELSCSPLHLLDIDLDLFDATAQAVTEKGERRAWTQETELLAVIAELTHSHLGATIRAHSKNAPNIDPLRIPRPWDDKAQDNAASHEDLLRLAEGGG